ncbi:MAG: hypothetical protein H6Q53_1103 [Deltaproteobacteria bacterium]|nr:hypothetical protein [Deltaproteobacteria bacterium]
MIILGRIESVCRNNFRVYLLSFFRLFLFLGLLCQLFLFIGVKKDEGRILAGEGSGCWIMAFPEDIEEFLVRNPFRIKFNLYRL